MTDTSSTSSGGRPAAAPGSGTPAGIMLTLGAILLILMIGFGVRSTFILSLAGYTCAFALFALSINLMLGGLGEVPLGQCIFFGVGAYGTAMLTIEAGVPFVAAVPVAMAASAVLAIGIGWLTLRLTGAYFSIVSWGLAGVMMVAAMNLEVTGGPLGLFGFPSLTVGPVDLTDPQSYFFFTAVILLLVLAFLARVRSSRFGHAIESIRQSRHLAQSVGVDVFRERLKMLVLSAPVAALAGALCLPYTQIVTPEVFSVVLTVDALLAVLIGGTGLLFGPVIGTAIFTILPQFLKLDPNVKVLVFSLAIILVMMLAPGGLHQIGRAVMARLTRGEGGR
ncbi:branched-chain amino acid ABC transporter permease [Tistrella mobilis]